MKFCKTHWDLAKKIIDDHGMSSLIGNEETVKEAIAAELSGEQSKFDPLMSMNNHWWAQALANGGLYLMGTNEDGSNDGHYCPICEFEKNAKGFVAEEAIRDVAGQMRDYCYEQKLIARPS